MSHSQRFRPVNIGPIHFYATTTDAEAFEGDSFVIVPATDGFYFDTSTNAPVKSRVDFRCVDALGASSIILAGQTGTITANILALSASLTVPSLTVTSLTAASAAITTGLVVTGTTSLAGTSILGDVSIGTAGANKDLLVYGGVAGITGAFTGDVDIDGDLQGNTATYSGNVLCESDLTVQGDTIVQDVYVSDHLQITCTDADPAVVVNQQGTGDILLLEDNGVEVFVLHDGGITKLTGTLEVTGAMVLGSTLDLTGLASLDGGINVDDLFTVSSATGAITGSSTLDVTGLSSLDGGIDVNAAAFTVSTAGAVSAASTLGVTGSATLAGITVIGGHTSMAKSLTVGTQRNTTARDLRCVQISTDTAILAGGYDDHTGAMLYTHMTGGWSTADLRVRISSSFTTYNAADAIIIAYAKTTVRDALDVGGITTLTGLLNADGGIDVNAKCTIASATGDIATDGDLSVAGDLHVSGVVSVNTFPTSIARYDATATISIPAGCNGLILEIVGGGGGAGGIQGTSDSSGGGGAGGYVKIYITKQMFTDLSLSAIYFQCGTGGAGKDTNENGDPGLPSYCKENDVDGNQIAQADGGQEGFRGAEYSRGGLSGYGSVELAYDDICEIIYGEIGNRGHNTGISTPVMFGGYGGKSHFGRGGRGASEWSLPLSGIKGGGGGGTIQSAGVGSGNGGNGMMQITFY